MRVLSAAGASDDPVVQSKRHHPRLALAFAVKHVEGILHVREEVLSSCEAYVAVKPVVIGLVGIGDDEVLATLDLYPVRQFVIDRVAVIKEAALLDEQSPGVWARPPGHPSERPDAGDVGERLDRESHMAALDRHRHVLVVDPAIMVAHDFMPGLDHGGGTRKGA